MPFACTVNEPQIVAPLGYGLGHHPPGERSPALWRRVTPRLIAAHEAAVRAVKSARGAPQAGVCLQLPAIEPVRPDDPACVAACDELRHEMEDVFLADLHGDFVGVQYYTRMRADPALSERFAPAPAGTRLTQMGWEVRPDGLHRAIASAARTGLPCTSPRTASRPTTTPSGSPTARPPRPGPRATGDGIDVRAYLYWSSFDNFEWAEGYRPTFGLVGIDRDDDLRRIVRPSARLLRDRMHGIVGRFDRGWSGVRAGPRRSPV